MGDEYADDSYIREGRYGLPGPHDTNNAMRMYRDRDPYGNGTSRRLYAQHLDWVASHPTDYQKSQEMQGDARWLSVEDYGAKYGSNVTRSQFGAYAADANAAKGRYIRGLARLIGLVKYGMFLEAQAEKKGTTIASASGSFEIVGMLPLEYSSSKGRIDVVENEKYSSDFGDGTSRVGFFVRLRYSPSEEQSDLYTSFNLIVASGTAVGVNEHLLTTDPSNDGPYYYSDDYWDSWSATEHTSFFGDISAVVNTNSSASRSLQVMFFGFRNGNWTSLGLATFGFEYSQCNLRYYESLESYD